MASRDLTVRLVGDDDTGRAFRSAGDNVDGFGSKAGRAGAAIGLAFGGAAVAGVAGLGAALFQGVKDAASYEQITDQLAQTLKSTGNAAGTSVDQLKQYAGELESLSGVDEELILSSQNVLATFTNIKNTVGEGNDVFDQASLAALNLSTTMGGDLQGASVLVGKALNDPIRGMSALSKAGVQLTDEQKLMVQQMVASGDTMGAQKIILGELTTQFGGAAAAAGEGLTGSLARAKDAFSDTFREVGERLLPKLAEFAEWVAVALPAAMDTIGPVFDRVRGWFTGLGDSGDQTAARFQGSFERIKTLLGDLRDTFETIIEAVRVAWDTWGHTLTEYAEAAWRNISQVIEGALKVIKGILDVFIGVLTGDWSRAWDGIKGIVGGAWQAIEGVVRQAVNMIQTIMRATLDAVLGDWRGKWEQIKASTTSALDAIVSFVGGLPGRAAGALAGLAGAIVGVATSAWGGFRSAVSAGIDGVIGLVGGLPDRIAGAMGDLGSRLVSAGRDLIAGLARGIREAANGILQSTLNWVTDKIPDWKGPPAKDARLLYGAGKLVMGGFEQGIRDSVGGVERAFGDVTARMGTVGMASAMPLPGRSDQSAVIALLQEQNALLRAMPRETQHLQRRAALV